MAKKNKYIQPAVGATILLAVIGVALAHGETKPKPVVSNVKQSACGPYRNDGTVRLGGKSLKVELAKNSQESTKGLGGRPCILDDQGMLFPFAKPSVIPIWMKDMKFPIDIIWINTAHKIVAIEIDESPSTYPDKFENKAPAQFVLEIKANESKELGVTLGSSVDF